MSPEKASFLDADRMEFAIKVSGYGEDMYLLGIVERDSGTMYELTHTIEAALIYTSAVECGRVAMAMEKTGITTCVMLLVDGKPVRELETAILVQSADRANAIPTEQITAIMHTIEKMVGFDRETTKDGRVELAAAASVMGSVLGYFAAQAYIAGGSTEKYILNVAEQGRLTAAKIKALAAANSAIRAAATKDKPDGTRPE